MQRQPVYWLHAHRYTGSMNLTQALKGNMGDPGKRVEQYFTTPEVGRSHSSDETFVMKVERRASVI